jgi:hypothetical protein
MIWIAAEICLTGMIGYQPIWNWPKLNLVSSSMSVVITPSICCKYTIFPIVPSLPYPTTLLIYYGVRFKVIEIMNYFTSSKHID